MQRPTPLRPERIRTLEKPFGWIAFRVLSCGILERLSPAAMLLYFFLSLVADENGMSFYGERRLTSILKMSKAVIASARAELCLLDLLAFDGRLYQVLSLPDACGAGVGRQRRSSSDGPVAVAEALHAFTLKLAGRI
jgi:hypothetical protein